MIKIGPWRRRHGLPAALLGALALVASLSGAAGATQPSAEPAAGPVACSTDALQASLHIDQVTVTSAQVNATGKFAPAAGIESQFGGPFTGLPSYCDVTLTQTDSANDRITLKMWLPDRWNGRFQGVGGGGFACGINYGLMATALTNGYASASTNCGHDNSWLDGSFALNADRTLNHPLLDNFASAGIHDMTVTGKAVTRTYYAEKPAYSYFNGCSNGGRMGLMEAQRYPDDYDGIASGAPATNLTRFIPALIWPQLVMKESHDLLPTCKQQAFKDAVVKACDSLDGVTDGVIGDPDACHWNPKRLIGVQTACGTITPADSAVMAKILQGPRSHGRFLWYGLEKGAALSYLGVVTTTGDAASGRPMPLATTYLGSWLQRNPDWDWHTLTYDRFNQLFDQSVKEFGSTLASDDPDLSAFRKSGGKIVLWHGLADPLIFPQGTVDYYQRVQQASGGAAATDSFARLFLAPGAEHCASGAGPAPSDPLAAVVNWVEHGKAPKTLPAELTDPSTHKVTVTRLLCAYPLVARYTGRGDTADAGNYRCAARYTG